MQRGTDMKKQTIVELDLDVYGWIKDRERVMEQIENHIAAMFRLHRHDTKQVRRTGCFHVELSLPEIERETPCPKCGKKVVGTAHGDYCPNLYCKWGWEVDKEPLPCPHDYIEAFVDGSTKRIGWTCDSCGKKL